MSPQSRSSTHSPDHSDTSDFNARRWYDTDPVLLEVINFMELAPIQAERYAQRLIQGVEKHVARDMLMQVYDNIKVEAGRQNRWYDSNRVLSVAIELLRIMPPDAQRVAAMQFIESIQEDETAYSILKASFAKTEEALATLNEEDEAAISSALQGARETANTAKRGAQPAVKKRTAASTAPHNPNNSTTRQ
jgi:hypothetical protein